MSLRWTECDRLESHIERLDCRTSKLNDGFHLLDHRTKRMERKINAGLVAQAAAGLGGLAAFITALHNAGIFGG